MGGIAMTEPAPSGAEAGGRAAVVAIERISAWEGREVVIRGWLYNLRESGKLLFPIFRDGTGLLQGVIVQKAVPPEVFSLARGLTQESSVKSCSRSPRRSRFRSRPKSTASISS
jgi:aspartyl-tRNA synthetase